MTLQYHYIVPGDDFVHAGEASGHLKGVLRQLGYPGDAIRRVAVSMYEGEINMVIHANGGEIDAEIDDHGITIVLRDQGPGIPDVERPCRRAGAPPAMRSGPRASAPVWACPI